MQQGKKNKDKNYKGKSKTWPCSEVTCLFLHKATVTNSFKLPEYEVNLVTILFKIIPTANNKNFKKFLCIQYQNTYLGISFVKPHKTSLRYNIAQEQLKERNINDNILCS